jgi:nucleolar protein 14
MGWYPLARRGIRNPRTHFASSSKAAFPGDWRPVELKAMGPFVKKGGKPTAAPRGGRSGVKATGGASKKKSGSFAKGPNPFDVRSNAKTKYEVLGRRVKGTGRNVAAARADAEAKRKKSLASQFKLRHKANAFHDRRLGETNPEMTLEDKMMVRFQTERKRKMRNAQAFALQDSDDEDRDGDELFLTHGGQKIDDFEKLRGETALGDERDDDDDETRKMDREIISKLHFGGGGESEGPSDHKKTHKEIMQEVMVKSKLFKAERQKNKAAQEDTTEQLDEDFDSLKNLLSFRPTKGTKEYDELVKEERKAAPPDEFDKLTRELTFEAKAQASERRLSPEEAAKREHDRLAELEKKRIARMKGEDDDDSDDEGGKKGRKGKKGKKKAEIVMLPPQTDDDLAFDYAMDQQFGAVQEEEEEEGELEDEEAEEEEEEEDSDADSDDEEKDGDEEEEDEEEEEEEEANAEEEEEDEDDDESKAAKKAERLRKRSEAAAELPFVFPCPESLEELTELFKQHASGSSERRALIIERLIKYYSVKLSAENQPKMRSFFAILVRQFLKWAKSYAVYKSDLDALARHLYVLAQDVGDAAGVVARELLVTIHKRLHSTKASSKYATLAELLLFQALTQIFPTSDLRHNVVSPLETLLSESLARGGIESRSDVVCALFTCTLLLQVTKEKQRFTPEVVVFVRKLLRVFAVGEPSHWLRTELVEWLSSNAEGELPALALGEASTASSPQVLRALLAIVELVAAQYAALPSVDELLYPSYLLLHEISRSLLPKHEQLLAVIASVHDRLSDCWQQREPLRLQTFGPSVLPAFTPKFDANYTVRKDKTLDRDQAQTKQLTRQVKRARKNAARELRRDASFLAREKQEEETRRVADKKDKQREIWKWLEEQNATFNQQAKKGGEMLKGGGSAPAKKRRVARKQ